MLITVVTKDIEKGEQINLVLIESSIKISLSCYFNLTDSFGLQFISLVKKIGLYNSGPVSHRTNTTSACIICARFTTGLLKIPNFVQIIAERVAASYPSVVSLARSKLLQPHLSLFWINRTVQLS